MEIIIGIIAAVVGVGVGAGGVIGYNKSKEKGGKNRADDLVKKAKHEASDIVLAAKKEAMEISDRGKSDEAERRKDWKRTENRLAEREISLDTRSTQLDKKSENLVRQEKQLEDLKNEVRDIRGKAQEKLEKIAGLSKADAKTKLIQMTERDIKNDLSSLIIKEQQSFSENADETAESILLTAMERMSSEVTADRTVTALKLPDDEMKGRIIGKEGRNIQALQRATGVDFMVDDTPGMVVLSSFDPIRRQVARYALERLMKDGRINPSSIEEAVAKAEKEIDKEVNRAGEDAAREVGVVGIPRELLRLLGELKFRTSYGQNVLRHSIEVAHLCALMAAELGANVGLAKRAGLLHDIGKATDHETEGSHTQIGVDLAKKYKENAEVIHAIAAHHNDIEPTTVEAVLVQAADAISAARPGARQETLENYIKRLEKLEEIANSHQGVSSSFAIQAGREIRIIVKPDEVGDSETALVAREICKQIESELDYPGQIKVNVIRETRSIDYAK